MDRGGIERSDKMKLADQMMTDFDFNARKELAGNQRLLFMLESNASEPLQITTGTLSN